MFDVNKLQSGGIWIPAENKDSDWLLIALHGSQGSCHDFEGLAEFFQIPDLNYLYLNGPISAYSKYRWYEHPNQRQQAYQLLESAFDQAARAGYPPERTFMMGFSQGAALTFEFGARYPHLLAGYIALSGRIEDLPALLNQGDPLIIRRGKWLATHGTRDYNLGIEVIRDQVEQLRAAGFHIDYQEYDKIHEFDAKEELPYIKQWILEKLSL